MKSMTRFFLIALTLATGAPMTVFATGAGTIGSAYTGAVNNSLDPSPNCTAIQTVQTKQSPFTTVATYARASCTSQDIQGHMMFNIAKSAVQVSVGLTEDTAEITTVYGPLGDLWGEFPKK